MSISIKCVIRIFHEENLKWDGWYWFSLKILVNRFIISIEIHVYYWICLDKILLYLSKYVWDYINLIYYYFAIPSSFISHLNMKCMKLILFIQSVYYPLCLHYKNLWCLMFNDTPNLITANEHKLMISCFFK